MNKEESVMSRSTVIILRGRNGGELAYKALGMMKADEMITPDDSVLIKPNITVMKPSSTGITTDPSVVEGVIRYLKDLGVDRVAIGEGGGCDVTQAFKELGFEEVAKRHGVELIDVNRDEGVKIEVPNPRFIKSFWLSKSIMEYDRIISVPKLKTHTGEWMVTLSMKNMMGLLSAGKRGEIHREDRGIVDLLQIVSPTITVIDGIIGGEGHELYSSPVEMNILIAGRDYVAVDAVAAAIMDFSGDELPRHIKLASSLGLGTSDINSIRIIGDASIQDVKRRFRRAE